MPVFPTVAHQPKGNAAVSMHVPVHPVWTCAACGRPWPCPSRQRQLLAEYADARVSLSVFLSACFVQACADLATMPAGVLYRRFLTWPHEMPIDPDR